MVREIPESGKAALLAITVFAAVAALLAGAMILTPLPGPGTVRSVSLQVDGPGWSIDYAADATANRTAFALLLEAADRLRFEVSWTSYSAPLDSVLVDSINGTRSGDGGFWWLYWVDGRYGDVGADRKVLSDGSDVLWAFRTYPPTEG